MNSRRPPQFDYACEGDGLTRGEAWLAAGCGVVSVALLIMGTWYIHDAFKLRTEVVQVEPATRAVLVQP